MNHRTATYLSPQLAHCCKALGMSVGLAATPPYKSLIYNALCSAGYLLARMRYCLTQTNIFVSRRLRRKLFRSHTDCTNLHRLASRCALAPPAESTRHIADRIVPL